MSAQYTPLLVGALAVLAVVSLAISPRVRTANGFFRGWSETGVHPGVWTLVLSQVTTWIFARSLLNAAILGYYYGIAGTLAYTAYYGSFLTGWLIVDRLRFRHNAGNVQSFIDERFGRFGTGCFNGLISLRLLSEVFANLLVVGIVFGTAGSTGHGVSIAAVTIVTLAYSMNGGLRASLRTDVLQMGVLLVLLAALFTLMLVHPLFDAGAVLASSPDPAGAGWVLLIVAALQVWSYPLHDPVMMDRGFIASRSVTRRSFLHAFWISAVCILAFGLLGVFAGLHRTGDEVMFDALARLLGEPATLILSAALVISAASTLDSTFSSAAKLAVQDMGLFRSTPRDGRLAMILFAAGGILLVYIGPKDLFAAVAVSGTASLFLAPVIVFSIWGGREVARWCFPVAFFAAVGGALLYFLQTSGYVGWLGPLTGLEHKYSHLLVISAVALAAGFSAFALGLRPRDPSSRSA